MAPQWQPPRITGDADRPAKHDLRRSGT